MAQTVDAVSIAYFTVIENERTGWTGGLLVLNGSGRPLEFQCTLPVRPTKTHEILFGATLRSHLIVEVIGKLLMEKVRTPLSLVCCDQPESLRLDVFCAAPVVLVAEAAESDEGPITDDMLAGYGTVPFAGGTLRAAIERMESVRDLSEKFADVPDVVEPFERIREAIREAQSQIARAA